MNCQSKNCSLLQRASGQYQEISVWTLGKSLNFLGLGFHICKTAINNVYPAFYIRLLLVNYAGDKDNFSPLLV